MWCVVVRVGFVVDVVVTDEFIVVAVAVVLTIAVVIRIARIVYAFNIFVVAVEKLMKLERNK